MFKFFKHPEAKKPSYFLLKDFKSQKFYTPAEGIFTSDVLQAKVFPIGSLTNVLMRLNKLKRGGVIILLPFFNLENQDRVVTLLEKVRNEGTSTKTLDYDDALYYSKNGWQISEPKPMFGVKPKQNKRYLPPIIPSLNELVDLGIPLSTPLPTLNTSSSDFTYDFWYGNSSTEEPSTRASLSPQEEEAKRWEEELRKAKAEKERVEREELARQAEAERKRIKAERKRKEKEIKRKEKLDIRPYYLSHDTKIVWKEYPLQLTEDTPLFKSRIDQTPLLTSFLEDFFSSRFHKIPITSQGVWVDGELRASNTTLDLTLLPTKDIVDAYAYLVKELEWVYEEEFRFLEETLSDPILSVFDFICDLELSTKGILLHVGILPGEIFYKWSFMYENFTCHEKPPSCVKSYLRDDIVSWRRENKGLLESKKYRETTWWDNEVLESTTPPPQTNVVYVSYFPESEVIKVGRSSDWKSRGSLYKRHAGNLEETNGVMKLCHFVEVPTTGDAIVDKYILFCAETRLINLAKEGMTLVDGNEFFKGMSVQDFCLQVEQSFKDVTIAEILQARSVSKLKQFCYSEKRDSEPLMARLLELRESEN